MKKLTAVLLALVLMLSFALAEEATDVIVDFDTLVPEEVRQQGEYIQASDLPVEFWLPYPSYVTFIETDFSDELRQQGMFLLLTLEKGTDNDQIAFMANDTAGTLENFVAEIEKNEAISEIQVASVNGIPAVSYKAHTDAFDIYYATYALEGKYLTVYFPITDNEDFQLIAAYIGISFRYYDDSEG